MMMDRAMFVVDSSSRLLYLALPVDEQDWQQENVTTVIGGSPEQVMALAVAADASPRIFIVSQHNDVYQGELL